MTSTAKRSANLRYVPYHELAGRPNVIVDGSPTDGTVLCLTHWPGIASPDDLAADLSAQMAIRYLDSFDRHGGAAAVSNNHFDQDGLVAVYALAHSDDAIRRRDLLIDVARAGDFARYSDRNAARISMAIAAFADPLRSPLGNLPTSYPEMAAALYREVLDRLSELCDHPERYVALWETEDAQLTATLDALTSGAVTIDEDRDLDLAIVTIPESDTSSGGHRFASAWSSGLHPMGLYNATDCFAILQLQGPRVTFTYRYETWVQYRSRIPRPRVHLEPLADLLSANEPGSQQWVAEPVSSLTPELKVDGDGRTDLDPVLVSALVKDYLRSAPAAWDPYRTGGSESARPN